MKDDGIRASSSTAEASRPGRVTLLEHSLWRRLTRATDLRDMAQAWAPLMHSQIAGADYTAVFLADPDGGRPRIAAGWPENRVAGGSLVAAAEDALGSGKGTVRGAVGAGGEPTGGLVAVAAPLTVDGRTLGAVALEIEPPDAQTLKAAMRQLQWGGAWLRDALRRDEAGRAATRYDHAVQALNAVVSVAEREDIATATRAAVTDLATRFACDRVSLGFRRALRTARVVAISHSAQFGKRMKLVRQIGAAMDEAIDQRGPVLWPDAGADPPVAAHRAERLGRAQGAGHVLTIPLYAAGRFVGALTFERPAERPFDAAEIEILEAVATVMAPIVEEKRRNDRWLVTKAAEVVVRELGRVFGPSHLGRKLALIALMLATAFLVVARGPDRVNSDAVVEGAVSRTVAAPFDGFLAESFARAGDAVAAGAVLVRLDDRELALQRLGLVTELQRHRLEYDQALATRDRAEAQVKRSQIAQTEAEIALIDKQLERTELRAPFDGLVTAGDLSQSIGAAVARGDALLTVAPAGDYRITLGVDERRIADVALGQPGTLVVTALPERGFPFEVSKITPVAEYGEGTTRFRVEARLTDGTEGLQPGMEGIAKIDVGERRLVAIWTRPLVDWAQIAAWRWLNLGEG